MAAIQGICCEGGSGFGGGLLCAGMVAAGKWFGVMVLSVMLSLDVVRELGFSCRDCFMVFGIQLGSLVEEEWRKAKGWLAVDNSVLVLTVHVGIATQAEYITKVCYLFDDEVDAVNNFIRRTLLTFSAV
ncbi:hypothetical protein Droror1_Dr00002641 [Drosera rotundifolia]